MTPRDRLHARSMNFARPRLVLPARAREREAGVTAQHSPVAPVKSGRNNGDTPERTVVGDHFSGGLGAGLGWSPTALPSWSC